MLRTIFVAAIAVYGIYYAIAQGAFGALLFYLWLAYFRPESWVWEAGWLYALNLSLLGGVYLLLRSVVSGLDWRFDLRSTLLLGFIGVAAASTASTQHTAWAQQYLIEFGKVVVITFLMSRLMTDERKFRTVILVIAVSLGFEGAKQGWATLILRPGGINTNQIPHLGDNNGVAVGMLMCTAMLIGLAQTATNKYEKLFLRFLTIGVAYRAISTYSRGAFLSAGAMILIYVLRSKHKVRSFVGVAVVAGVIGSVLPPEFWDRMSTISVNEDELEDASSQSRLHFWRVAVDMANDHPVIGVGLNAYHLSYNEYDFSQGFYGRSRAVHSSWFGILAELGYVGLFVYLAIFWMAIVACWKSASLAKRGLAPPEMHSLAVALQTALVACAVGSSFVPWQYNEMYWNTVGLTMTLQRLTMATAAAKRDTINPSGPQAFAPHAQRRTA